MLDNHGVEIFVFLPLFFALGVYEFYVNTFVSSYHPDTVGERNTRFFPEDRFFGFVYDGRVDHDGGSEKFIFSWFFFSLAGRDDSDIFSNLWCCQTYSFIFKHRR